MRIRHQMEAPAFEEAKQEILQHKVTPYVLTVAATLLAVRMVNKNQTPTIIIVNGK